jgi:acetyltransferase-like isoleucine patch superfamily enzyme
MAFERILKSTAFLYAPGLLNPLASLLLAAMRAKKQGVAGLSEYSLGLTVYFIAESLTLMGLKALGPITLGRYVHMGANAVVLHNLSERCTAVGVPARVIKRNWQY